jgi:hypothetical protein
VDLLLGSLVSARGRLWASGAAAGAVAFWCLGALALGGVPVQVPQTSRCEAPDARILCVVGDQGGVRLAAVLLLGVLAVVAGTALVAALTAPALSAIAGGHRTGWGPVGWATRRHERRRTRLAAGADAGRLTWYPAGDGEVRPTRAGNAFAALQQRVHHRHGLDLSTCWPLIEQTLPVDARNRLEVGSHRLAGRIQNLLWTLLALGWLPWLWGRLAVVVAAGSVALAVLLWWAVAAAAEQYCALVEATVAAHRHAMYAAVGWPLPISIAGEPEHGRAFTGYLNRLHPFPDIPLKWSGDLAG